MIGLENPLNSLQKSSAPASLSLIQELFTSNTMKPDENASTKKVSGYELDSPRTSLSDTDPSLQAAIHTMEEIHILGAVWNAVFSVAQQIPETFKKLMNG